MTMHRFSPTILLLFALLLAVPGLATEREEDPSEAMVRKIAKDLRCAVCQNQSVYESNSNLAKDMLGVIRDKVRAGDSEASIRDYFFQRYGDYIYLEPTRRGMNWLLWAGPFIGLALGAWALWAAFGHWKRNRSTATPIAPDPTPTDVGRDDPLRERIQKELDRVDI